MEQRNRLGEIKNTAWLTAILAIQPILDVIAFFTRSGEATIAGYIRLALLVLLPVFMFLKTKEKKRFLAVLLLTGIYCLLHIWNSRRVGYISPAYDIRYMASVIQLPVFALCFQHALLDDEMKEAALRGIGIAAFLTLLFFFLSWLSDTGNVTYGPGMGYSGWVIMDNRNANSTNYAFFACICVFLVLRSSDRGLRTAVLLAVNALLLANGTKGCYFSIFVIFGGFALLLVLRSVLLKTACDRRLVLLLVMLCVFSAAIYPLTPRYRVTEDQRKAVTGQQGEIEGTLLEMGIDITDMSPEERFENPQVREVFEYYYWRYMGFRPDLFDRFGMDRVLQYYKMSTEVGKLIDSRVIKRSYSALIFQDSDFLTRLLGFEVSEVGFTGDYDLENDWHAIFYYYGYLGFALYVGFFLYYIFRILRTVKRKGRNCLTLENFAFGMCLVIMIGLAHFSGAALRRPNVSIWIALLLGLIYYVTEEKPNEA